MSSKSLMDIIASKKKELDAKNNRKEKTAKMKEGRNQIRILPGWREGDDTFFHDYGQHFVKGLDGQIKAVFTCADKTYGKPCAVCDGLARAAATCDDDLVIKKLDEAKAGTRVLVNALIIGSDAPNKPVILELPGGLFGQVVDLMMEWGNILDPNEGRDIVVNRSGTGLNTEYTCQPAAKQTAIPASVLKSLNNLDDYVREESEESMKRALGAINAVAGILPPAGTGGDTPRLAKPVSAVLEDDDIDDLREIAELKEVEMRQADTSVVEDVPVAPAAAAAVTDSSLDDLLEGLG